MSTTVDQALFTVLSAHAGLGALIGTSTDMRCYPVEAPPAAALPLLVYQVISSNPNPSHDPTEQRKDEIVIQLTALASTQLEAAQILHQVRLALEGSTMKGDLSDERALPRAEEANVHGRSADFHVWHNPDA